MRTETPIFSSHGCNGHRYAGHRYAGCMPGEPKRHESGQPFIHEIHSRTSLALQEKFHFCHQGGIRWSRTIYRQRASQKHPCFVENTRKYSTLELFPCHVTWMVPSIISDHRNGIHCVNSAHKATVHPRAGRRLCPCLRQCHENEFHSFSREWLTAATLAL